MNAADVLAEAATAWNDGAGLEITCPEYEVAALLAHGEQGVAILPDGTLWALERAAKNPVTLYALVPLSAEAGDTDA